MRVTPSYEPMEVADDAPIMRLVRAAAARAGRTISRRRMGGGCDANILNRRGLEVVNLGTGMREIHTTNEWLKVSDMVAAAEVTLAAIELSSGPLRPPGPGGSSWRRRRGRPARRAAPRAGHGEPEQPTVTATSDRRDADAA